MSGDGKSTLMTPFSLKASITSVETIYIVPSSGGSRFSTSPYVILLTGISIPSILTLNTHPMYSI
ncbi:MAG: hypothetical protein LZ173_10085, partial [Thaumarchaeota archaeon]|nr:hypothetical protein [Candidatus Geocrenenecus arthurdayi]